MSSNALGVVAAIAVLAATGALTGRVVAPVWNAMKAQEPALRIHSTRAARPGVTLALLGGYRGLVADMFWLRLHGHWEERDLVGTDALLRVVAAVDPRPIYFWQNGARIIAYDFVAWRIDVAGGYDRMPWDEQRRIVREQARQALTHLTEAIVFHGDSPDLWIERGNIEYGRLHDFSAAAESYRRAAESKNAPAYAARLHAEMLRRAGRKADALAWLVKLHPTLPRDDEAAAADVVLARIRDLERELGVAEGAAYGLRM